MLQDLTSRIGLILMDLMSLYSPESERFVSFQLHTTLVVQNFVC